MLMVICVKGYFVKFMGSLNYFVCVIKIFVDLNDYVVCVGVNDCEK